MKTEKRMIQEEITVFVASDGNEFDNEYECNAYEANLERKKNLLDLLDKMSNIKQATINIPESIDINEGQGELRAYFITSKEDLDIIKDYVTKKYITTGSFGVYHRTSTCGWDDLPEYNCWYLDTYYFEWSNNVQEDEAVHRLIRLETFANDIKEFSRDVQAVLKD